MRLLACVLPALLLGAAAQPPAARVPPNAFQTWGVDPKKALSFGSGRLSVQISATPCEIPAQNEGCRFDGVSNQAIVTVLEPGLPPFRMTSDDQASFVRAAIVRIASKPERLGVVVDNQWGGSAGLTAVTVIEPVIGGFRAVPLEHHGSRALTGEVTILPGTLSKDGDPGFLLEAPRLNYSNECNACVPRPPLVLTVGNGGTVDISAVPALRPVFARRLPVYRRVCTSNIRERNGNCAAFVAVAARLGRTAAAWRVMLSHYRREPTGYPAALRAFLVTEGYLTAAAARALPLD